MPQLLATLTLPAILGQQIRGGRGTEWDTWTRLTCEEGKRPLGNHFYSFSMTDLAQQLLTTLGKTFVNIKAENSLVGR